MRCTHPWTLTVITLQDMILHTAWIVANTYRLGGNHFWIFFSNSPQWHSKNLRPIEQPPVLLVQDWRYVYCTSEPSLTSRPSENATNQSLFIRFEAHQAADLVPGRVEDAGADEVVRVRINAFQHTEAWTYDLQRRNVFQIQDVTSNQSTFTMYWINDKMLCCNLQMVYLVFGLFMVHRMLSLKDSLRLLSRPAKSVQRR